ncbi:sensor histidine kinase [Spirosoma pulveris]
METRYSNQDELMQALVLPVFIGTMNSILLGSYYWTDWHVFVLATATLGLLSFGVWQLNNAMGLYVNRLFPHVHQTLIRSLVLLAGCLVDGFTVIFMVFLLFQWIDGHWFPMPPGRLLWALLAEFVTVTLVIALYEGIRAFERWERALRETEELKKASLQNQFESLKSQINPHFLFNSLNTLSSLIEEDPVQAEVFVEEMASVYRYLLRANEMPMVSLADELAFAQSYFHLLRTRYGANIQLKQAIDEQFIHHLLPPLTLQLLLENAVKHNIVLPEQPLRISISTSSEGLLVVQNNLQRKNTRVFSHQVGLANIATQFRLLGEGALRVDDDDKYFTVTLPLIRP